MLYPLALTRLRFAWPDVGAFDRTQKTAGFRCRDVLADLGTNWWLRCLQQQLVPWMIKPNPGTEPLHFPLGTSNIFLFNVESLGVRITRVLPTVQ